MEAQAQAQELLQYLLPVLMRAKTAIICGIEIIVYIMRMSSSGIIEDFVDKIVQGLNKKQQRRHGHGGESLASKRTTQ